MAQVQGQLDEILRENEGQRDKGTKIRRAFGSCNDSCAVARAT